MACQPGSSGGSARLSFSSIPNAWGLTASPVVSWRRMVGVPPSAASHWSVGSQYDLGRLLSTTSTKVCVQKPSTNINITLSLLSDEDGITYLPAISARHANRYDKILKIIRYIPGGLLNQFRESHHPARVLYHANALPSTHQRTSIRGLSTSFQFSTTIHTRLCAGRLATIPSVFECKAGCDIRSPHSFFRPVLL
jgi:hypothetical protein